MGEKEYSEKRRATRRRLSGLLPGKVLDDSTSEMINCKPVDISEGGLGVLIAEQYATGHLFRLVTPQKEIRLKVVWIQRDFGKNDLYRYGLLCIDEDVNLFELFEAAGCFK